MKPSTCLFLAIIYTVSPIDLIPDPAVFAFGAGFVDDAVVDILALIYALRRKGK